ncbi:MAG: ferrous iron transport protein A [Bdellovibrionaceae bacterium]|nr:ferrous iron transport protein A [Pseudobdellovibrionaceae bacterium]
MSIEFNRPYKVQRIIKSIQNPEISDRLYDLGFIEGLEIVVEKRLPLAGPWIVSSSMIYVALRDEEFQLLELK